MLLNPKKITNKSGYFLLKNLILILILLGSCQLQAQDKLTLDYKQLYNRFIIKPTWANLKLLAFTNPDLFKETMYKYGYVLNKSDSLYTANTMVGDPNFYIEKGTDGLSMIFTEGGSFIPVLRSELKQMLKGEPVAFEDGYEVYQLNQPYQGLNYHFKIFVKDNEEGTIVDLVYKN